jgi:hypothetical protein
MVSTVAEGEETVAFRLCSCSSTLALLERGLEGTLVDLRWQAMLGSWTVMEAGNPLSSGNGRDGKLLQWCLHPALASLFIYRRMMKQL